MAENLLSPGVLTRENDQSQITQGPQSAGAAILGPAVKGPVNIPTIVTSYSDYISKFGGNFRSGSGIHEYLTSISAYNYFQQGGESLLVTRVVSGSFTAATSSLVENGVGSGSFVLETISEGVLSNSGDSTGASGSLINGTQDNVRWEIPSVNIPNGTFNLLIRRGNDNINQKVVLESWPNLSLDPNSNNYIEKVIGNQKDTLSSGAISTTGDYGVKSRFVRVKEVTNPTLDYFDNVGLAKTALTGSVPITGSGSFGGATGNLSGVDGLVANDYTASISLLANTDAFRFDVVSVPGLNHAEDSAAVTLLVSVAEQRGDAIAIIDLVPETANIATAVSEASEINSTYAAAYYPHVQVNSPNTGKLKFVPPSTVIPSVFANNDRIGAEWFAPAGFTRGGINVVQAKRKLSPSDRNTLYLGKVNPIGTFPGQGVVVYGQKTLTNTASALDRINVRRLLIELKTYIGQVGQTLVFENNTVATRNSFLAKVRPYMDSIQQRGGLFAYKVLMDDTNNTSDVIDRNQIIGQIFVQPARAAEFVILDFNVSPTGVTI